MQFLEKHRIVLAGILIGGLAGYLYYAYVGCSSGTCSITSKPINSSLYGSLLGGLLGSSLSNNNSKKKMIQLIKNILGLGSKADLKELVKNGALILDVRSKGEYESGHVKGSVAPPVCAVLQQKTY